MKTADNRLGITIQTAQVAISGRLRELQGQQDRFARLTLSPVMGMDLHADMHVGIFEISGPPNQVNALLATAKRDHEIQTHAVLTGHLGVLYPDGRASVVQTVQFHPR